jgi:hypothetical protein
MGRPGIGHHHAATGSRDDFGLEPALSALPNKTPERDAKQKESGTGEKHHRSLFQIMQIMLDSLGQNPERNLPHSRYNYTQTQATCLDEMAGKRTDI